MAWCSVSILLVIVYTKFATLNKKLKDISIMKKYSHVETISPSVRNWYKTWRNDNNWVLLVQMTEAFVKEFSLSNVFGLVQCPLNSQVFFTQKF